MDEIIEKCIDLIYKDDVDHVLFAFSDAYTWLIGNKFSAENVQSIPNRFLEQVSQGMKQRNVKRKIISVLEIGNIPFRAQNAIANDIVGKFLCFMTGDEAIDFLGNLIGQYALIVPEPLFRNAKSFAGMHQTPDTSPISNDLPMTDEMILYCWQYYWFYSALGY